MFYVCAVFKLCEFVPTHFFVQDIRCIFRKRSWCSFSCWWRMSKCFWTLFALVFAACSCFRFLGCRLPILAFGKQNLRPIVRLLLWKLRSRRRWARILASLHQRLPLGLWLYVTLDFCLVEEASNDRACTPAGVSSFNSASTVLIVLQTQAQEKDFSMLPML